MKKIIIFKKNKSLADILFLGFAFIIQFAAYGSEGDILREIKVPVGTDKFGIGIETDDKGNLYYTNYQSPFLYKLDKDGNLLTSLPLKDASTGLDISLSAITWDNNRKMMWAGSENGNNRVYLINLETGVATQKFFLNTPGEYLIDGIAFDHTDNTIWITPDASSRIEHFKDDGSYLGTLYPKNLNGNLLGTVSGVLVGNGDLLYIGLSSQSKLVKIKKSDGSFISSFLTVGGRNEDMACDLVNFGQSGAIWSKDAYDNTIRAFEVEQGSCICSTCPPTAIINAATICNGETFSVNGKNYTAAGIYSDTVASPFHCDSIYITSLKVNPTHRIENSILLCKGESYIFNSNQYERSGIYYDTLQTNYGCDSLIVTMLKIDSLKLNPGPDTFICRGSSIQLEAGASTITYLWNTGATSALITVTPDKETKFHVMATRGDCMETDSVLIKVVHPPLAGFAKNLTDTISRLNTACFIDTSKGNINWKWDFGDGNCSYEQHPCYTFGTTGDHLVTLTVSDQWGCMDTSVNVFKIKNDFNVFVPNIFTPNGDGVNDNFLINGNGIKSLNCTIFNRWGIKLFEWEGPSGGWNGITTDGLHAPDAVYFFVLKAQSFTGSIKMEHGSFELIRN